MPGAVLGDELDAVAAHGELEGEGRVAAVAAVDADAGAEGAGAADAERGEGRGGLVWGGWSRAGAWRRSLGCPRRARGLPGRLVALAGRRFARLGGGRLGPIDAVCFGTSATFLSFLKSS